MKRSDVRPVKAVSLQDFRRTDAVNVITRARTATSDNDVTWRKWFPIDLDPVRPSGISSTDEEHEAAKVRGREVWNPAQTALSVRIDHLRVELEAERDMTLYE